MGNRDWLEDKYVKEWLSGLSKRTATNDKPNFEKWLDFIKMSPTEQIEKRIQDLRSNNPRERSFFEQKVIEYIATLDTAYKPATYRSKIKAVMSFFSRNRLPLHFKRGEQNQAINKDKKGEVVSSWIPTNEEIRVVYGLAIPTNEEIRVVYGLADVRDRALILLLYQSGLSESDVSALNVEDVPELYGAIDGHVFFQKQRNKSKQLQRTCISNECIHDLRLYLMERGNPQKDALFKTHKGERLAVRYINECIKTLVKKAFPDRAKDWKTKNLRDAFNDSLLRANITAEIKDYMMGHKREGARGSYECSPTTIKEAYVKAFVNLSVNHGTQSRRIAEEMKSSLLTLTKTITEQQDELKNLKEAFSQLRSDTQFTRDTFNIMLQTLKPRARCLVPLLCVEVGW